MPGPVDGPGDAEVGELHRAVRHDEDVGRLDVAVHHPGLVRGAERQRGLAHDRADPLGLERALALHQRRQRLAGHELHDEVGEVVVLAVVEDRRDVRVAEVRGVEGLAAEPPREDLLLVGAGSQHLDGDRPREHGVVGLPDVAHAPGRDARGQRVAVTEHAGPSCSRFTGRLARLTAKA